MNLMAWDISGAKVFLGLPAAVNPALDPQIQVGLDTALALAETYCNRLFSYAAETAAFTHPGSGVLQLARYPLEQVSNVSNDSGTISNKNYHVIYGAGQIVFDGARGGHTVTVTYAGGYKVLPPDLLLALWGIFGQVYGSMNAAGGGAPTGQVVQSITVPDVGTVRYESSGSSTGGAGGGAVGMIPATSVSLLNLYRLMVC